MELSNNIVSQFVKITNDDNRKQPQTTAYGKVVMYNNERYVQLDGSDLLTPADTTVHVKDDERVTVTIKGHGAVIDGNLSDISASNDHLIFVENDLASFKVTTDGMFLTLRDEVDQRFTDFAVTVDGMFLDVRNEFDQRFTDFSVTVDGMFLEVRNEVKQQFTDFEVTVNGLFLETKNEFDGKLAEFQVTTDGMFVTVQNNINAVDKKITDFKVTTDGMFVTVQNNINAVDKKITDFKVTTDGMFVTVGNNIDSHTNLINGLRGDVNWLGEQNTEVHNSISSLSIRADQIQSAVSGKIGASDVGTIVTQNATSWGLSIYGKLSGTHYNFDGTNFSIGSSSGGTTAYHAAGYSKWVHSDGSWTQVDSGGMKWGKGSMTSGYHCLMHAGEYTCNSEATQTVYLPDEFKGKPFKIVTAVKRIYISSNDYVTNARFPLLSFYAEALNINHSAGTFQVYASVRAWNRSNINGWGTVIGDGSHAAEAEALKPVVAYWAFV